MFDIHSIVLENFKLYHGEHSFEFPKAPGLYFITGDNKKYSQLGPNATGKSTILDAIYWCLYGKTLRGLRGNDVVTWGEKDCFVELWLTVGDRLFGVRRTQNPNRLSYLDLRGEHPIDQDVLQKVIRIGPEAFTYAVMLPQFGQSFFELTPALKLNLFSQVMGLEYWLEKSEKAMKKATAINGEIESLKADLTSKLDWAARLSEEILDLGKKEDAYVDIINAGLAQLADSVSEIEKQQSIDEAVLAKLEGTISELLEKIDRVEGKRKVYENNIHKLEIEQSSLTVKLNFAELAVENLSKLKGECPTCKQKVDAKHIKAERSALVAKAVGLNSQADEVCAAITSNRKFLKRLTEEIKNYNTQIQITEREVIGPLHKVATATSKLLELEIERRKLESTPKSNVYTNIISEKKAEGKHLKDEITKQEQLISARNADFEAVNYWVQGFKRVRLFVIDETLRTYEIEVNSSLAALGLADWEVLVDVERENKSGGVTKGFTVLVNGPEHSGPVKFESWSGGETQRLQLAGDLGLANLIMTQAGLEGKIEFYDEPSAHLSQQGLLDLAETLQQRAVSTGKRIFLIDHHTIEFGGFAGTITAVRGKKGSCFQ